VNGKVETGGSRLDSLKLTIAALIAAATLAAFYYYADRAPLAVRVVGILAGAAVAAVVALQTEPGRRLRDFIVEARNEVRRVVWPSRKETVQTTMVVLATVLVVAVLLWLFDVLLLWLVRLATGRGG
jgi:preprotein translocase subunit SecE